MAAYIRSYATRYIYNSMFYVKSQNSSTLNYLFKNNLKSKITPHSCTRYLMCQVLKLKESVIMNTDKPLTSCNTEKQNFRFKRFFEFEDLNFLHQNSDSPDYRTFLFPNNQDIHGIVQIAESLNPLTVQQASQVIFSIYNIIRPSFKDYYKHSDYLAIDSEVVSSPTLDKVLAVLNNEFKKLPDNILVPTLFALSAMQIPDKTNCLIENLIIESCRRLPTLPLTEISKLSTVIYVLRMSHFYLAPAVDVISSQVDNCNNEESLKCLAICLKNTLPLISPHCIGRFVTKVQEFVHQGEDLSYQTSVACLEVLAKTDDRLQYVDLQQILLNFVIKFVPKLNTVEVISLFHKVLSCDCNNNAVILALEKRVIELAKLSSSGLEKLALFHCVRRNASTLQFKQQIQNNIEECLKFVKIQDEFQMELVLSTLVNLYPLKNEALVETYLKDAFVDLRFTLPYYLCREYLLMKIRFQKITSKRPTGTELNWIEILDYKIRNCIHPSEYAFFCSLWIDVSPSTIPEQFLIQLLDVLPQVDQIELNHLAVGLNLITMKASLKYTQDIFYQLKYSIQEICKKNISKSSNLYIYSLMNQLISDSSSVKSERFYISKRNLDGYKSFLDDGNFCIKSISLTSKLMKRYNICLPELLDKMAYNVVERLSCQRGAAVSRLLALCFQVNYLPEVEGFLAKCQDLIISQNDSLSCNNILCSALSFGSFQALDHKLVQLIFNHDFVEKMQKEPHVSIKSKHRLQLALAVLNRLVCLDYPQFDLPWVQDGFYQKVYADSVKRLNSTEEEVSRVLHQVLPEDGCIHVKSLAPYYIEIDFECQTNKSNYPVAYSDIDTSEFKRKVQSSASDSQKIALNFLRESHFCNNLLKINGYEELRKRHLEILGYKVIQIPYYEWNSLQLSNSEAKLDYMHRKIFH